MDVINDSAFTRLVLLGSRLWVCEADLDHRGRSGRRLLHRPSGFENIQEGHQAVDLAYTWQNSIRAYCSSYNIPLASFWTFKDQGPYGERVQRYYAGFDELVVNPNPPPAYIVHYSKTAYSLFDSLQSFTYNSCTG